MAIDWTKIVNKYKGLWVALKDDERTVVSSGKTAKQAWDEARKKGYEKPILTKMPKELVGYVGVKWNSSIRNTADLIRPVIPVELIYKNLVVPYEALVDSGADFCIFDVQIANILGIDVENGRHDFVSGITGTKEPIYFHNITVKIGGWPHKVDVAFGKLGDFGHGVVGQKGFFDSFIVKFNYTKEEVELKQKS